MSTLWLVRHGETNWNVEGRFQGSSDQPLNERGEQQAASLASHLENMTFAGIYCSDLIRVQRTAELALNGNNESVVLDARLQEFDFGSWEGLNWEEIKKTSADDLELWVEDREQNPHGGERLSDVVGRVSAFLEEVRSAFGKDEHVLIFAHGGTLAVLICILLGNDPNRWWQYRFSNCALSEVLLVKNGAILARLNDQSHLADMD